MFDPREAATDRPLDKRAYPEYNDINDTMIQSAFDT